jgi:hypothetical protein
MSPRKKDRGTSKTEGLVFRKDLAMKMSIKI